MSHKRWHLLPPPAGAPPAGRGGPENRGHPAPWDGPDTTGRLTAQLLHNRGVTGDPEAFLGAGPALVGDPFLLPEMGVAVSRLRWALRQQQPIAIYGDFDVDGITATALLVHGLARLGARVVPYIPHRFNEGYGLNQPALERLHRQDIRLIVTADTGTTAHQEIAWAQARGLDILVTDHHTPGATLPPAMATINPHRQDSLYPFPDLAGVGVALKLLQALGAVPGDDDLDLVALGTVADMVPLLGENRYLVKEGLAHLNRSPRPGLACLMEAAGLAAGQVDTEAISFGLAPRLNAAGRLAHARLSYSLLTTQSPGEAQRQAATLEAHNRERQRLTEEVETRARQAVLAQAAVSGMPPLLMVGDPAFALGVVGIAASRLVGEFYRPTILFHQGAEVCQGSARSIPEFNMVSALSRCQPWLLHFGGHPQAAGFTARRGHLPQLQQRLLELADRELAGLDLRSYLDIDAQVGLPDLTGSLLHFLSRLAPFGRGNPSPAFLSRGVTVEAARPLGNHGKHLRLKLRQGRAVWEAVAFGLGEHHALPDTAEPVDVVYTLGVNYWRGEEFLELRVLDFAPAGSVSA